MNDWSTRYEKSLLFMVPVQQASVQPVVDHATRLMTAAFRAYVKTRGRWRGVHRCVCGARSSNVDYELPDGSVTNSLCVHYLAYHREEVPNADVVAVLLFNVDEQEPTNAELATGRA